MLGKVNRFLMGLVPLVVLCATGAMANEVNDFYQRFLDLLKNDRTSELESLVRDNRGVASKCHAIIKEKISGETAGEKTEAYVLVADELEELVLFTSGRQDCEAAQRLYARAGQAVTPDGQFIKLKRIVRLCPTLTDAQTRLGDVSKKLGRFDDAVSAYEKAMALKDTPEACLGLAETLFAAGLCHRSLPYFEKVLAMQPENPRAKKYLEPARREITREKAGLLTSDEIGDRLWQDPGGNLMCMCPVFARLVGRVRLHEVTFAADSANLSTSAKKQLQEVAAALQSDRLKGGYYLIEGHADNTGSTWYNKRLSLERAQAVKTYLARTDGVDPASLSVAEMGASRPWTTNETSQGRRLNRRIEILRLENQRDTGRSHQ
ncbi:MAG: OmpA family protein [Desulfomonilaceae bacterium]